MRKELYYAVHVSVQQMAEIHSIKLIRIKSKFRRV